MKVQRFQAGSLQEALQLVRENLGPDASVLATRELRKGGLFKKSVVEVEASDELSNSPDMQTRSAMKSEGPQATSKQSLGAEREQPTPRQNRVLAPAQASEQYNLNAQNLQFNAAHSLVSDSEERIVGSRIPPAQASVSNEVPTSASYSFESEPGHTAARARWHQTELPPSMNSAQFETMSVLLEEGFEPTLARQLVEDASDRCNARQLDDAWVLQGQICQVLAKTLRTGRAIDSVEHGQARTVAFIGPTGVGKTTTLAKIAAGLRFEFGAQIGLITLDTFRMGAVDQLLQYADLISAPLEVVSSADQVAGALDRLKESDLILIDTAGRSPRDASQLHVLQEMLGGATPDETILVASATSSTAHVRNTIEEFSQLQPTSLAITKFDESTCFGGWFELLQELPIPVSYLSAGQDVPNDLVYASGRRLASWLLGKAQRDN